MTHPTIDITTIALETKLAIACRRMDLRQPADVGLTPEEAQKVDDALKDGFSIMHLIAADAELRTVVGAKLALRKCGTPLGQALADIVPATPMPLGLCSSCGGPPQSTLGACLTAQCSSCGLLFPMPFNSEAR